MVEKTLCIGAEQGLNVDMARKMADLSEKYPCTSVLRYNDADVNMGSLLNIVAMGIVHGDTVTVRCSGQREQQALDAYVALLK
ncbi:MAG: HPr family phosphocarrier protein [Clostridiales bacterium]|nr:HPr family phosphocarrier protein [Clostridiales bacterium]